MMYEDLYEALQELTTIKGPYGFSFRAYINKSGDKKACLQLLNGPIKTLEEVADQVEKIVFYDYCVVRGSKIYLNVPKLQYHIRYEVRSFSNDTSF